MRSAFILNIMAMLMCGIHAHADVFSKAISWDPTVTVVATDVIESDGKIIFKGLRINTSDKKNIYLAYAPENNGHNPADNMLLVLCRELTDGIYTTYDTEFTQTNRQYVMSSELPMQKYLFGPKMFYFKQTERTCLPWGSEVIDYPWGTSRYVQNLICKVSDEFDMPTRLHYERCGE